MRSYWHLCILFGSVLLGHPWLATAAVSAAENHSSGIPVAQVGDRRQSDLHWADSADPWSDADQWARRSHQAPSGVLIARNDAVPDRIPPAADRHHPRYRISPDLATAPEEDTFHSLADFAAKGPRCMRGGEQILFERGKDYQGMLRLKSCTKAASGEVLVGVYGSGSNPRILGGRTLQDLGLEWEKVEDPRFNGKTVAHLRQAPLYRAGPLPDGVIQLYDRGERMTLARSPNRRTRDASTDHYFKAIEYRERHVKECQAIACISGEDAEDPTALLRRYGLGPKTDAVLRLSPWSLLRSRIAWYSAKDNEFAVEGSLRRPENGNRMPSPGFGFILLNALPLLDTAGEWYYDAAERSLYFWAPDGGRPNGAETVLAFAGKGPLVNVDFQDAALDIKVEGLALKYSPDSALRVARARHATIIGVTIEKSEEEGISINKMTGSVTISDCEVNDSASDGISLAKIKGETLLTRNHIRRPGRIENQPALGMKFSGFSQRGSGRLVATRNVIEDPGYAGMQIGAMGGSLEIRDNQFSGFCSVLNDCGGIYFNGKKNSSKQTRLIAGNRFTGGVGNTAGTPNPNAHIASAIYLDHSASDVEIIGNTITDSHSVDGGIYINGGRHNRVRDNRVSAIFGPALGMRRNDETAFAMDSNEISNNTFTTKSAGWGVIRLMDKVKMDAADMRKAIKADNRLRHETAPDLLYMEQDEGGPRP